MTDKEKLQWFMKYPNSPIRSRHLRDGYDIVYGNVLEWWEGKKVVSDCKLILRRVGESLTEEERKKCYNLRNPFDLNLIKRFIITINVSPNIVYLHPDQVELTDYLRSISVDIDNLVEKGIAEYE